MPTGATRAQACGLLHLQPAPPGLHTTAPRMEYMTYLVWCQAANKAEEGGCESVPPQAAAPPAGASLHGGKRALDWLTWSAGACFKTCKGRREVRQTAIFLGEKNKNKNN